MYSPISSCRRAPAWPFAAGGTAVFVFSFCGIFTSYFWGWPRLPFFPAIQFSVLVTLLLLAIQALDVNRRGIIRVVSFPALCAVAALFSSGLQMPILFSLSWLVHDISLTMRFSSGIISGIESALVASAAGRIFNIPFIPGVSVRVGCAGFILGLAVASPLWEVASSLYWAAMGILLAVEVGSARELSPTESERSSRWRMVKPIVALTPLFMIFATTYAYMSHTYTGECKLAPDISFEAPLVLCLLSGLLSPFAWPVLFLIVGWPVAVYFLLPTRISTAKASAFTRPAITRIIATTLWVSTLGLGALTIVQEAGVLPRKRLIRQIELPVALARLQSSSIDGIYNELLRASTSAGLSARIVFPGRTVAITKVAHKESSDGRWADTFSYDAELTAEISVKKNMPSILEIGGRISETPIAFEKANIRYHRPTWSTSDQRSEGEMRLTGSNFVLIMRERAASGKEGELLKQLLAHLR